MKAYIAAPFGQQAEVVKKAEELVALGVTVTSRWRFENDAPSGAIGSHREYYLEKAYIDLDDIDAASILILLSDKISLTGGKHVEFGYALAKGKTIYLVGLVENIFHWLPQVQHVGWDALKATLKESLYAKQHATSATTP